MNESVIERFASTPEGRELLDREEARLNAELAAVSELRASAVKYAAARKKFDVSPFDWDLCRTASKSIDRLHAAARRVAELEDQCNSEP